MPGTSRTPRGSRRPPSPAPPSTSPPPSHGGSSACSPRPIASASTTRLLLLDLARAHGLGAIVSDHPIHLPMAGEITVDFFLPRAGVVIECDSWKHHRSRASFEADRARDLELTARGDVPVRVTDGQLRGTRAQLAQLLSAVVTGPLRSRSRS